MPDPQKILATVRRATELFRATKGRVGNVVVPPEPTDFLVAGDLHGNLRGFKAMLDRADLARNPGRHFVLQELIHDIHADPDEGRPDRSHRLVDVACALKCQVPDRVHWILGNHELSELTGRPIAKGGVPLNRLFRQGLEESYGEAAEAIAAAYLDLFAALPLAVRSSNRVFLVHTLPTAADLDTFAVDILDRVGWTAEESRRGGPVYAMTWGRDISAATADRFAALVDADLFICGHQPSDEGYFVGNPRLLVLDGTEPRAASCLFPATGAITQERLVAGVEIVGMPA